MDGRQHFDQLGGVAAQFEALPDRNLVKAYEGRFGAGNAFEIRPDDVVEHVRPQCVDGGCQCVHAQRPGAAAADGVEHQGQGGDVVEVRVGEHHVVDGGHLVEGEVADARAGVHEQVRIDQERGGAAVLGDGARATQHANLHCERPSACVFCRHLVSKRVAPSHSGSWGRNAMEANRCA
ncbi:hypothetical protein D9M69_555700 [compost metagenome]